MLHLPNLRCDKNLIKLVFENLISNAIKYTSKLQDATIEIGSKGTSENHIELYIKDNGVGFDMETLKVIRLTEEFKNLPVVMLSSSQMETDVVNSYQIGANGFVVKPIVFTEFIKTIKGIGYFWAILNTSPYKL